MIPVLVNNTEAMLKVKLLTVKDELEKSVKALHKAGILHVETSKELGPLDIEELQQEKENLKRLLSSVNDALANVPEDQRIQPREDIEVIYTRPLRELEEEVSGLCNRLDTLYRRTLQPTETLDVLDYLHRNLMPLSKRGDFHLNDLSYTGKYLFSRVFVMNKDVYFNYQDRINVHLLESVVTHTEEDTIVYSVGREEELEAFESLITGAEGTILDIPDEDSSLTEFLKTSGEKIQSLRQELAGLFQELISETLANLDRLTLLKQVLEAESERLAILDRASQARYVVLIEGWVPENNIEPAISEIKDEIPDIYIDITQPAEGEEPPTKMKNRGGFKPFQVVVNLFGTPSYREWDPTPVIAYSFALFFGLMAGDVVYALGVIALAKFLIPRFVDDPEAESVKLMQRMIYISGGVGVVLGLLSGSYMGNFQTLFGIGDLALSKAVENALQNPVTFIVLSLGIGFVHVNIAHALALAKAIKEKDPWTIVAKIGLFTLQFGIPGMIHSLLGVTLPGVSPSLFDYLNYVMMVGIVMVIIASIAQNKGMGAIMWMFDITGLLGDVMSYARLAGVGLATYYLATTFNQLSGLFREIMPGTFGLIVGSIIGIFILAFGHGINVLLTALTGFIHSLRLCFVEFLFKFYDGAGTRYSPFVLKKKAAA